MTSLEDDRWCSLQLQTANSAVQPLVWPASCACLQMQHILEVMWARFAAVKCGPALPRSCDDRPHAYLQVVTFLEDMWAQFAAANSRMPGTQLCPRRLRDLNPGSPWVYQLCCAYSLCQEAAGQANTGTGGEAWAGSQACRVMQAVWTLPAATLQELKGRSLTLQELGLQVRQGRQCAASVLIEVQPTCADPHTLSKLHVCLQLQVIAVCILP